MANSKSGTKAELVYAPLGGAGEIGMNLYLYGLGPPDDRSWLVVDLGVTFPGEFEPGVDVIMPDTRFLEEERERIAGIVLTHAHEDHFGAVIDLWPELRVPVYATGFTAQLLRAKQAEFGGGLDLPINEIEPGARFRVGPFDLEYVTMAHSIPEPNALAIRGAGGLVLHSGDWKLDPEPVIGMPTDEARLRQLGEEGIAALICDSTNVMRSGVSPSEGEVGRTIAEIIKKARNRVAVTTFASNVARILSIALAARAAGRHLVIAGRALNRVINVAIETGKLPTDFRYLQQDEFAYLPREKVVLLCTGSQGEPRAAVARIAARQHPAVSLDPGDMIIFSSRTIPGNEPSVGYIQNALADQGVEIISDSDAAVHVTGHPRRGELEQMYAWCRPDAVIPMHGESRHLEEHARLAKANGVKYAIPARNGTVVRLLPGPPEIIDEVPSGRVFRDGDLILDSDDVSIRQRRKLSYVGLVMVAIALSAKGEVLTECEVEIDGVPEEDEQGEAMPEIIALAVEGALESIPRPRRKDIDLVREAARRAARSAVAGVWGKKPIVKVLITVV